jgi:DNA-binding MarR family transcriptional regulator
MTTRLSHLDYQALAELRYQIRRFLRFSEQAARGLGLEPRQHQLLLALKGLPEGVRPRIGELAERLQIQHHSGVELVNRLVAGGYVRRTRGGQDRREVLLELTLRGERLLSELSLHHQEELRMQGPALIAALKRVMLGGRSVAAPAKEAREKASRTGHKSGRVRIARQ